RGRIERHARVSRMAGARISGWRGAARRRRMVAARLLEVDGRIDGAGGFRIEQLPPARSASGSIYEKCRVDHSGKISLLRDGNASPNWSNSFDRDDRRR